MKKKIRVPHVLAVATVAALTVASTGCPNKVCKQGDPNCSSTSSGGSGGTSSSIAA